MTKAKVKSLVITKKSNHNRQPQHTQQTHEHTAHNTDHFDFINQHERAQLYTMSSADVVWQEKTKKIR